MPDKVDSGRLDPAELRHGLVSVQTAATDAAEPLKHPRNFTRPSRDMADAIFGEMNPDSLRTGRQAIDAAVTKPLNLGMLLRVIVKAGSERGIDPPHGVAVEPVGSRYGARLAQSGEAGYFQSTPERDVLDGLGRPGRFTVQAEF